MQHHHNPLVTVQTSSQVTCPPHELLVLVLLHLQLALSLDTDRVHLAPLLAPILISLPPLVHALGKAAVHAWLLHINQRGGVRAVCDLAVDIGALLNCQGSSVGPVLNLIGCSLQASPEALGQVHRNWCRWWVEWLVATLHDVLWERNGVIAWKAVEVGDVLIAVCVDGCAQLVRLGVPLLLVESLYCAREGGEDVVDALALGAARKDGSERLIGDGFREWGGDGDRAVEGEERRCSNLCSWTLAIAQSQS